MDMVTKRFRELMDRLGSEEQTIIFQQFEIQMQEYLHDNLENIRLADQFSTTLANHRYQTLVDLIPDIVYRIDPEGIFTFISDSIVSLGYTPEELLGEHFSTIIHPEDYPLISRKHVLGLLKGKATGPEKAPKLFDERRTGPRMTKYLEVRLMPKGSGEIANMQEYMFGTVNCFGEVVSTGIYDQQSGQEKKVLIGTVGVVRDITARKKAEEEKKRLEQQLYQAQKLEAIGRLTGGIAHDFNNMLGGIMGFADLLRRRISEKDEVLRHYSQVIYDTSQKAAGLTSSLLAFVRKEKSEIRVIDFHDAILRIFKLIEHTLDKRIKINLQLLAECANLEGDSAQLQNVLVNLAINAQDAMPNGGAIIVKTENISITSSDNSVPPPGEYFHLQFIDEGQGIPDELKEKIFEPFFTTKDPGRGTGLGLSIIRSTIENHKGFITLNSEFSKGTTFNLYFPLSGAVVCSTGEELETIPQGKGTILFIDDEAVIRQVVNEMLKDLGFQIVIKENAREGIDFFSRHYQNIDLVIIDLIMPEMNGYDCYLALKEIDPNMHVIIASGYAVNVETKKMMREKCLEFLQKPFEIKRLAKSIQKVLKKNCVPTSAHSEMPPMKPSEK